jgi:predicted TIM-barrel fold metal-dependent hydrolase
MTRRSWRTHSVEGLRRCVIAGCLAVVLLDVWSGGALAAEAGTVAQAIPVSPIPVDYHVHLLGDDLLRDWRALGVQFSRPDEVYRSPAALLGSEAKDDRPAALQQAVLVPMSHLYGSSELRAALGLTIEQERERTAHENDYVANQAARFGPRTRALCSVSAVRPYALAELERCRLLPGVVGIKLHLASSEVDLREARHLTALAEIADWAQTHDLQVLLHLDTQRRGTDIVDIERFLDIVVAPHPKLVMLIAHLGGSGGYGRWTQRVFAAIVVWIDRRETSGHPRPELYFDLSAVVLREASEGVAATSDEEAAALAGDLRRMAFRGVVFGSDYPVFDPRQALDVLVEMTALQPGEIGTILDNRVPGFFDRPAAATDP